MSQIQKFNAWRDHFNHMINGDILPNQGIVMLKGKRIPQVGMGIRLVAAAEETQPIKPKTKRRNKQSSVKRLHKKSKQKKKKTKPRIKPKSKTKKKTVKRTRKR